MADLIFVEPVAPITWRAPGTGGTNDITLASLGVGAGRQGEHHPLDGGTHTDARVGLYSWRFFCQFNTAPVFRDTVRIFGKTSDGANPDNDDGVGDIALSSLEKLFNLDLLGILMVDEEATGVRMVKHGSGLWLPYDDWAPVIVNDAADILSATAAHCGFDLIPTPPQANQ